MHPDESDQPHASQPLPGLRRDVVLLIALWSVIFFASLFTPPLLDDADATHAQAARAILATGDWVTLHVDGVRYLEKAPLPYWLVAISFRCFGINAFAAHLPGALAVLGLALLGYWWARRRFDRRTALYTGLATLTCTGVFLFTRVFIPDALLALLLAAALYAFESAIADESEVGIAPKTFAYPLWVALALGVLTKGLVVLVLFFATSALYLALTGSVRQWRRLRPMPGIAIFLAIAAPWHILASIRNTGGENGHGFAWFYFINEHVLRFLGRRTPRDYDKLPAALYWGLHIVWLFPWSLFLPAAVVLLWRNLRSNVLRSQGLAIAPSRLTPRARTVLLLWLFSVVVLLFFSLSTNQEYYTFPVYLPVLLLTSVALVQAEDAYDTDKSLRRTLLAGHAVLTMIGIVLSVALAVALYSSRHDAHAADIGSLLAHRGVSNYKLAMASFFDLTGPSFAALRLPAAMALVAFAVGPLAAWILRTRRQHFAATTAVALTSSIFLIAAHIALVRFAPALSSKNFADRITDLTHRQQIAPDTDVILFGDQAYGSSIPFYLDQQVKLVDGRSTSMYFGSTFQDAPPVFLTQQEFLTQWGRGPRKILFIPPERSDDAMRLLGADQIVLAAASGKLLITDRPLPPTPPVR